MSARPLKPKTISEKCWIEHGCWRETPKVGLKMWNPPRSLSGQQQSVSWPVPIFPPHLISQTYKPSARAADSFFMLIPDMTDAPAGQFDSIPSNMDSDHHKDLGRGHPSSSWIEVIVTIISISEMSLSLENQRDFQTISSSCIFKLAFKQQHVENHLPFSFSAFKHFMFFFSLEICKKNNQEEGDCQH